MGFNDSSNLLFICSTPGGAGYRLGRLLSCFNNVYWYCNRRNGEVPWDIFLSNEVKGRLISPYHYDRRTSKNMIPLVGERIEKYWNDSDLQFYYQTVWNQQMNIADAGSIIDHNYISWVIHDTPAYILSLFPNAKIINLIDTDIDQVVERYLATTSLFPIKFENKNVKPEYFTKYAADVDNLEKINISATQRDFWAWEMYNTPIYNKTMDNAYYLYVKDLLYTLHNKKNINEDGWINVSWNNIDILKIQEFLNSDNIDINYKKLLN